MSSRPEPTPHPHPFPYDPFQQEAIRSIREGVSTFVSAPTGAGKTVIAEAAVEEALAAGGTAIYTAPVKALSNQKYRDFHARHPDRVGILTGDVTLNPDAPILIMTTEIYRNTLFEGKNRFEGCRWVIFDEVHYLDDPERGTVWEEALLITPRQTEILALSATIPNADELAGWIERIHGRPVRVIRDAHRPVPLKFHFQCQDRIHKDLTTLKEQGYFGQEQWRQRNRAAGRRDFGRHRRGRFRRPGVAPHHPRPHFRPNRADHLVARLQETGQLPCIYFSFSRRRAEDLALEFARYDLIPEGLRRKLLDQFDALCARYEIGQERSAAEMRELVAKGIAFHHAGLLPTLKEVVEVLFTSRLIQVIVTTETFALGINMPARSVVLDTLVKRMGGLRTGRFTKQVLTVRSCMQMAGRAGRRGMDEAGFVYLRVNPWEVPYPAVERFVRGEPEQVVSRFNLTYATLLNLYRDFGQDLLPFYEQTFHAHQSSRHKQRETFALLGRKVTLLKELGYVQPSALAPTPPAHLTPGGERPEEGAENRGEGPRGQLTPKGAFASEFYGYELVLAELYDAGWLDELDVTDLGCFLLATVYEPRPGGGPPPRLPRRIHRLIEPVQETVDKIHARERNRRVSPLTKKPAFQLSAAMERWIQGQPFDAALRAAKTDEGELIRYFRMAIQLARTLRQNPRSSERLKETAGALLRAINRDLVDAEAELRRSL